MRRCRKHNSHEVFSIIAYARGLGVSVQVIEDSADRRRRRFAWG